MIDVALHGFSALHRFEADSLTHSGGLPHPGTHESSRSWLGRQLTGASSAWKPSSMPYAHNTLCFWGRRTMPISAEMVGIKLRSSLFMPALTMLADTWWRRTWAALSPHLLPVDRICFVVGPHGLQMASGSSEPSNLNRDTRSGGTRTFVNVGLNHGCAA